ncbi:MAG TPA: 3-hydroxyacyl-ACP dehydratase FabZ [Candidatus Dormibacteraeota bacterium]|nr:3-hydroxyacyl-ACP dehydratase FabZ [Candidatus Dormibacteraeota bacterium]
MTTQDATTTTATSELTLPLEAADIMRIIPHRYPFLLIDRVIELDPGKRVVAIKAVTANEPQFIGHFPGRPIMPGVLMVEALAQAGAVAVLSLPEYHGKLALFAGIDDCRFRRTVLPGETLRLEVTLEKLRGMFGRARAVATVDGEPAVEATISFVIPRDQSIAGGRADG